MTKFLHVIVCALLSFASYASTPQAVPESINDTTESHFKIHYTGNFEAGYLFPWEGFMRTSSGGVPVSTTHGVTLNRWLSVGLGASAWILYDHYYAYFYLSAHAAVRATLPISSKFRPFVDLKAGIFGRQNGIINPSLGYKFFWGERGGIYISAAFPVFFGEDDISFSGLLLNLGVDF